MKITLRSAVTALAFAYPMVLTPAFAEPASYGQSQHVARPAPTQAFSASCADERNEDGRNARQQRQNWRDDRPDANWDDAQHNGYYNGSTWRHGPPPAALNRRNGVTLGYQPWRRGERLGYYNRRYEEVDHRTLGRGSPRRGYHWVRDERGDDLLVATKSGVIIDIIINTPR